MDDESRDESGKYSETYPDSAFLDAVHKLPVASTQNVADEVGCSYDLAYRRLNDLYDEEEVEREEVGNSFVYYIPVSFGS
jgi:CTP-dependent riboflavin kinase